MYNKNLNPIKGKPIAEQKRIAEKQRQEQAIREQNLAKAVAAKKKIIKTESDLMAQIKYKEEKDMLAKLREYEPLYNEDDKCYCGLTSDD